MTAPEHDDDLPIRVVRGREPEPGNEPASVLIANDVIRNRAIPWPVKHVYMLLALWVDDDTRAGTFNRELLDDLAWSDAEVRAPGVDGAPELTVSEALDRGQLVGLWSIDGDHVQLHDADDRWHEDGDKSVLPGVLPSPVHLRRR
jgi:hypothetical protein